MRLLKSYKYILTMHMLKTSFLNPLLSPPSIPVSLAHILELPLASLLVPHSLQNLSEMMQATRDLLEWPLTQMDRQVGLSFSSHFHFALAGLLYRGFSHCLSTVRTRAQDLLTTLFFIHSPELNSTLT